MDEEKAIVRRRVEQLQGIRRTWFEWEWNNRHGQLTKTLVVEVDFSTEPRQS